MLAMESRVGPKGAFITTDAFAQRPEAKRAQFSLAAS